MVAALTPAPEQREQMTGQDRLWYPSPNEAPNKGARTGGNMKIAVMGILLAGAAFFSTAFSEQTQDPIPEELAKLHALSDDEMGLVDAARRLDLRLQKQIEVDRKVAQEHYAKGEEELAIGKGEEIVRIVELIEDAWEFVTRRYPRNARAQNYYGELLYDLKKEQARGERRWRMALSLDGNLSEAHNNLGLHYMHTGLYDEGLRHLSKALELEPENPDFLFNIVQIYLNYFPEIEKRYKNVKPRKHYRKAMQWSKKATKYAPDDYEILADYANNFYAAENFDTRANWDDAAEAWEHARKCATTKNQIFHTLINEGRAWLRAKEWAKATTRLDEAMKHHPGSDVIQALLDRARKRTSK